MTAISIIIPCFNGCRYANRCIESILSQEQFLHELIIIDAGSTDGSLEIINKFKSSSDKIKLVVGEDNGQSDAMNIGLSLATGLVIGFVNIDDWLFPGTLEIVNSCFSKSPNLDLLIGGFTIYTQGHHRYIPGSSSIYTLLNFTSFKWPLNPVAYFCRSSLHSRVGPFPINNAACMDYWFLLRAFNQSRRITTVDAIFGVFHIHGQNISQLLHNPAKHLRTARKEFVNEINSLPILILYVVVRIDETLSYYHRKLTEKIQYYYWRLFHSP